MRPSQVANIIAVLATRIGVIKMDISSDFAILDVKKGRAKLAKYFKDKKPALAVTIEAEILYPSGTDDGVSTEFAMFVKSVVFK